MFSFSASTLPELTQLSDYGLAVLRQVATRLTEGWSPNEIAAELGISRRFVATALDDLRAELERLT